LTLIFDESSEILGVEDYILSIEAFSFYLITFALIILFDLRIFDEF